MNQNFTNQKRFCGCCKRELPIGAFYINRKTQCADNYCKECRRESSREQREHEKYSRSVKRTRTYPVITRIQDPNLRKVLILHALQAVNESVARKRRKLHERELADFEETDMLNPKTTERCPE